MVLLASAGRPEVQRGPANALRCIENERQRSEGSRPDGAKFRERSNHYFCPALSRHACGTNTHVAPAKIQRIRNAWSQAATEAAQLANIGVRFTSGDSHITTPVAESPASTVLYLGSKEDFEQWRALNMRCQHLTGMYSFVRPDCARPGGSLIELVE
jgi:hypothetical protein